MHHNLIYVRGEERGCKGVAVKGQGENNDMCAY